MLSPHSQVIMRNAELFAQGKWLLVNAPERSIYRQFPAAYATWQQTIDMHRDQPHETFASHIDDLQDCTGAIIYMPKNKAQLTFIAHNLASLLAPGQHLALVGHNKEGIKSAAKLLAPFCDTVNKVDTAKHCALLIGTVKAGTPFNIADYRTSKTYTLDQTQWQVSGLPGVFSQQQLDEGTQFLLQHLPAKLPKRVLDFASGAGVVASYIGTTQPQTRLTLCDNSALAIDCASHTMQANGLTADIIASNGLENVEGQFDAIISNPPFHTGVKTDYGIADKFIAQSRQYLVKGGELRIVANRFLPYPDILEAEFGNVQTIAQSNRFAVYASIKRA